MNPRLEKLFKLPLYQRLGILALVLVAISLVFYFVLYAPQMDDLRQLQQRRTTLQKKLDEDRKIAKNLEKYRVEYERVQNRLDEALVELPNQKEVSTLLTTIASLAKDNGLDILKFQPGGEQNQGFYAAIPVSLNMVGNYHQVASFFSEVGNLSRIVNVGTLKMSKPKVSKEGVTEIQVECLATTYRFLEVDKAAKPGAGKKAPRKKGRK